VFEHSLHIREAVFDVGAHGVSDSLLEEFGGAEAVNGIVDFHLLEGVGHHPHGGESLTGADQRSVETVGDLGVGCVVQSVTGVVGQFGPGMRNVVSAFILIGVAEQVQSFYNKLGHLWASFVKL